ncbi:MAG: SRPBCC family protein [Saprospiraceae bacterium]
MDHPNVLCNHVTKEASFLVNAAPDVAFPLFTPIEEMKWADGWHPEILYSDEHQMHEGMVFRTPGHFLQEAHYHWIVSKYMPEKYQIEYTVSTANRYWVIKVRCEAADDHSTKATVRYTYTGFNELGNKLNEKAIHKMFEHNLNDWAEAINYYLITGKLLKNH